MRFNNTIQAVIIVSILYEYEEIKRKIGEEKYNQIQDFLNCHHHYCLADVYYEQSVWGEMEDWLKNTKKGEQS